MQQHDPTVQTGEAQLGVVTSYCPHCLDTGLADATDQTRKEISIVIGIEAHFSHIQDPATTKTNVTPTKVGVSQLGHNRMKG